MIHQDDENPDIEAAAFDIADYVQLLHYMALMMICTKLMSAWALFVQYWDNHRKLCMHRYPLLRLFLNLSGCDGGARNTSPLSSQQCEHETNTRGFSFHLRHGTDTKVQVRKFPFINLDYQLRLWRILSNVPFETPYYTGCVGLSKCLSKTHLLGGTRPQQLERRSEQIKSEKKKEQNYNKSCWRMQCHPQVYIMHACGEIRAPENV